MCFQGNHHTKLEFLWVLGIWIDSLLVYSPAPVSVISLSLADRLGAHGRHIWHGTLKQVLPHPQSLSVPDTKSNMVYNVSLFLLSLQGVLPSSLEFIDRKLPLF